MVLSVLLALALAVPGGCRTRRVPCDDPVVAARTFVDLMESGERDDALVWLSRAAKEHLDGLAQEATQRLGQPVTAADLLVPERSILARSDWLALRSVVGDEAWVDVRPPADAGTQGRGPWSAQRLVREGGCWKVDLFHAPAGVADPAAAEPPDAGPPDGGPR
jgi:hypothetical protein